MIGEVTRKWCMRLGAVLFFASIVNFFVWTEISLAIGGDALDGKIVGGRYYVERKGDFNEVSPETYLYSLVHTRATWWTAPLGVIGFLLMGLLGNKPVCEACKPGRQEYAFMFVGGAIGLGCGILLVALVPRLLDSLALRTPWVAIPEGSLIGLLIGLFSGGFFRKTEEP